jgi:hypothetical protein
MRKLLAIGIHIHHRQYLKMWEPQPLNPKGLHGLYRDNFTFNLPTKEQSITAFVRIKFTIELIFLVLFYIP